MTVKLFVRVLLANCLVIICFNLLMLLPELKIYLLAPNRRIFIGLSLYTFQFIMTRYLIQDVAWLTEPFKDKSILKGMLAFVIVLLLTIAFVTLLDTNSRVENNDNQWINFLTVFLLNSLPGALMEEWLFRYFPVRFVQSNSLKLTANVIFLLILLLFTLIHIPAYLFQYNTDLNSLGNVFVSGIFLFLIYFMTKNIIFTALFHAFGNNPKFLLHSDLNWQYFYASAFLITLAWPIAEHKIAQWRTR